MAGQLSGYEDGTFRPNEKITQTEAIVAIVKALGWGVVVDQTGTYPGNYITKASELKIFKGAVDTNSEYVIRGNAAIYIQCMYVDPGRYILHASGQIEFQEDRNRLHQRSGFRHCRSRENTGTGK